MKSAVLLKMAIAFLLFVVLFPSYGLSQQSHLRENRWVKLKITSTGIYRIDAAFLQQIGFNPNEADPGLIRIISAPGGMLAQDGLYSDGLALDLPLKVMGAGDGVFNEGDYVLFYAQGPDRWFYDENEALFKHEKNLYSDANYAFISIGPSNLGTGLTTIANLSAPEVSVQTFDEHLFYENEQRNILNSGREWYGEEFSFLNQQSFSFNLSGITANADFKVNARVMARDTRSTSFELSVNGQGLGEIPVASVSNGTYDFKGQDSEATFQVNQQALNGSENLPLDIFYNQDGGNGQGFLNYLRVNYPRQLQLYGNQTLFRSAAMLQHSRFGFRFPAPDGEIEIWDVSNPQNYANQSFSRANGMIEFTAEGGSIREYVVFQGSNFPNPEVVAEIPNQDLLSPDVPNLVIVVPLELISEAERLASFRRSHDGLRVKVVTTEQIYNDFASGRQDITAIRNYLKLLYQYDNTRLKYLLLFGDGSFDYKDRVPNNSNWVPIYESRQSLHPIFSYSSDDYFAFLDPGEGLWTENSQGDHDMEIGVGRLPVKSLREARTVVDKLIAYSSDNNALGPWRNRLSFVADDGDGNIHQRDADFLAENLESQQLDFNPEKLYLDAFEQVSTPIGEQSPSLKEQIDQAVEEGVLILNFTGHGGEIGWTEERILDIPQIRSWSNMKNLPLFVTATCEFGRYDDPFQVSGAEEVILSEKGAGIGLITTTRPVFSNTNFELNREFYNAVFTPIDGELPRLGDIIRITKNNSLRGSVNRNFSLLGDPSLRLAYPASSIVLTDINGSDPASEADTLKALSLVTMQGEVRNLANSLDSDFNGELEVSIYDKRQDVNTLGTEANVMTFKDRNQLLFKGKASVSNGQFQLTFQMPLDIDYRLGNGKVSLYAQDRQKNQDANGGLKNILIGQSADNITADNTAPQIQLYLNDLNFQSGNEVSPNSLLIANLSDASGINISEAGIGHEILMILDENEEEAVNLNSFYVSDLDSYQSGQVLYGLENLSPGAHTLRLRAWDSHNNSAEASIAFVVGEETGIQIISVNNYPNPVYEQSTFTLNHSHPGNNLRVQFSLFNSRGALIRRESQEINNSSADLEFNWDGLDQNGARLGNGTYIYQILLEDLEDASNTRYTNRLIIIN